MPDLGTPRERLDLYLNWLRRTGLSENTAKAYAAHSTRFIDWLEEQGPEYFDALTDPDVRDYAVKQYRREMLVTQKRTPATVAAHMSSLGSFYDHLGLGKPEGVSVDVPAAGKKGLVDTDLRKLMLALKRRGPRDYAIGSVLENTGIRVSEAVSLDVDDVAITERTGQVIVRYGKGGKPRTIPLNSTVRVELRKWLDVRPETTDPALFTNRVGERLSTRSVQRTLHEAGASVGVKVTPHVLRHTFGRRSVDSGTDLVVLGDLMGHKSMSTTAIYAKPRDEDYEAAVERLSRDGS